MCGLPSDKPESTLAERLAGWAARSGQRNVPESHSARSDPHRHSRREPTASACSNRPSNTLAGLQHGSSGRARQPASVRVSLPETEKTQSSPKLQQSRLPTAIFCRDRLVSPAATLASPVVVTIQETPFLPSAGGLAGSPLTGSCSIVPRAAHVSTCRSGPLESTADRRAEPRKKLSSHVGPRLTSSEEPD